MDKDELLPKVQGLKPIKFYGPDSYKTVTDNANCSGSSNLPLPFKLKRLLGPSSIWKVFKKQADVLAFASSKKCLMSFVFQQVSGERLFLAAHPSWLWHYDSQKDPKTRCSYEIIPEFTVCKLYFDLEYNTDVNPLHNGIEMLEVFIKIVNFFIMKVWSIKVSRQYILDLDSSTDTKFSRHLIYQLPNAVFRDNYNAGNFVKFVCKEIRLCVEQISLDNAFCNDFINECNIERHTVQNLYVTDTKGKRTLFCDEGVYTKNRHFRVFKSTKIGKNAPLTVSKENEYKSTKSCEDEQIFLDSLITYVLDGGTGLRILEFCMDNKIRDGELVEKKVFNVYSENSRISPFPKVDEFINSLIHPGHIWRSVYFQTSNVIVYDIVGNRYCGNIGRQHRSNNVKQIVDIANCSYYQKCHDPDCAGYRSPLQQLPPEVRFHLEDETDSDLSSVCDIQMLNSNSPTSANNKDDSYLPDNEDEELAEVLDAIEDISRMSDCELDLFNES